MKLTYRSAEGYARTEGAITLGWQWSFHKGDKILSTWDIDGGRPKSIPKKLHEALTAQTLFNNDLGNLIEDYKPIQRMS